MTDPLVPDADPTPAPEGSVPTEVDPQPEGHDEGLVAANGQYDPAAVQGPMREIAAAFRMNAEALHTLKQMQVELATQVKRGDRSEMMLQSTQSLNDTFRNLSSVQRELLQRLDKPGGGRGPLIPLMLLGLLVVFVAGVYVILTEVQKTKKAPAGMDPTEILQRERDIWKEARNEGARLSEKEIQRLTDSLEEAKERSRTLQQNLDTKVGELNDVDRRRRAAELERDEFAGQVRKAQGEVLAKKALEDEIHSLRDEKKNNDREVSDLEVRLERKRREAAWLRQRLADYGMDLPADDPPYIPPGQEPDPGLAAAMRQAAAAKKDPGESKMLNLITAGQKKIAEQAAAEAPDSRVPPPSTGPATTPRMPALEPQPIPPAPGGGAARGGDVPGGVPPRPGPPGQPARKPGELPPPIMRRRNAYERDPKQVQIVRTRINQLLDRTSATGETWQVTRIDGVSQNGLDGVIMLRYDGSGRLIDGIEAKDLRISVDSETRKVEFVVHDGVRVAQNRRVPLPRNGARVVVAEGESSSAWASSGLTMVRKK